MKKLNIRLLILLLLSFGLNLARSQETTNASGGDAIGEGGSASYSIGQLVYNNYSGTTGLVTEGVQQPYEFSIDTGQDKLDINLFPSVFPNPTDDILIINIEKYVSEKASFQLFDLNGKLLKSEAITSQKTGLSIFGLSSGAYFLRVNPNNREMKIFKIIKI